MGDPPFDRAFICFFARAFAEIALDLAEAQKTRGVSCSDDIAAGRERDVLGGGTGMELVIREIFTPTE